MTYWDFFLSASSIISTGIITYIPLRHDIHNKKVHNAFIFFASVAVLTGVGATYNLWRESAKSEEQRTIQETKNTEERKKQEEDFSNQLKKMRSSDSLEMIETRSYIVDSMVSIYQGESIRNKRQLDSLQASKQRRLTPTDQTRLIKRIKDLMINNNLPNTTPITVAGPMGNEEARIYAREVFSFLKSKGYNAITLSNGIGDGVVGVTSGNEGKGFLIKYTKPDYISIDVSVIGNRP